MIKVVIFILGMAGITYLHIGLRIQKSAQSIGTKDVTTYITIMVLTSILGALLLVGVKPPSPVLPYEIVFENIGRRLLGE